MLHADNRILFSSKKKWMIKPWKDMNELKCKSLSESSQSEKAAYYMIPNIRHCGPLFSKFAVIHNWHVLFGVYFYNFFCLLYPLKKKDKINKWNELENQNSK